MPLGMHILKLGTYIMNRIAIEEDWNAEILKVYYLENKSYCYFNGQLVFNSGEGKCLILPRYKLYMNFRFALTKTWYSRDPKKNKYSWILLILQWSQFLTLESVI